MKIAYNPKTAAALTTAPANDDITFDLSGLSIYVKGIRFKGTDTTYSVFKKHGSSGGGYDGLVPVPNYNNDSKNRYLREDGTWLYVAVTDLNVLLSETTTAKFRPVVLGLTYDTLASNLAKSVTGLVHVTTKMYALPSTGYLYASKLFSGGKEVLVEHLSLSNYVTLNTNLTITGAKTFSVTNGFTYSGIAEATDNVFRPVWFSYNGVIGRPVYDTSFKYNPYTKELVSGNFSTSGKYISSFASGTWINGVTNAVIKAIYTGYGAILSMPVKDGRVSLSSYPANNNYIYFGYATASQISAGTNSFNKLMYWDAVNNNLHADVFTGALAGNASTATKLTSSAGSAVLPIYFSDGKPVACTASLVFSNLSNSGNNISITVAGQNRTLTPTYATNCDTVDGIHASKFPYINNSGIWRVYGNYAAAALADNTVGLSAWAFGETRNTNISYLGILKPSASTCGIGANGTIVVFGQGDTHMGIAVDYHGANFQVFGGNADKIVWRKKVAFTDSNVASATNATNIYVHQHTSNNVEYPLVWANLSNANTVLGNLLYKSYSHLTYNPSARRIIAGLFYANNASGPHFTGVSTSGNWAYLRLNNSTCYWDIATKNNSGSGGLWLARYNGSDNGIFVSTGSLVGIGTSSPSQKLHVSGNILATGIITAAHFYESSDILLKENISSILGTDNIPILRKFNWKKDGKVGYGFIALELEELGYYELVNGNEDGTKTVHYTAALSLVVAKLQNKIKELEKKIEILKCKN